MCCGTCAQWRYRVPATQKAFVCEKERKENGQTAAPDLSAASLILFLQHFLSSPVLGKVQTQIEGKEEERIPTTDDKIGQTCDQSKVRKTCTHTQIR